MPNPKARGLRFQNRYINKYTFPGRMEESIQPFIAQIINIIDFKEIKTGTPFALYTSDLEDLAPKERDK
jgi:hypothetical protein